jgi:hypothetical protein
MEYTLLDINDEGFVSGRCGGAGRERGAQALLWRSRARARPHSTAALWLAGRSRRAAPRAPCRPLTHTPASPPPPTPQCTLMLENGDTREDLMLPKGTEEADKLAESIKEQFAAGQELVVGVLKAMGEEMINTVKVINQAS